MALMKQIYIAMHEDGLEMDNAIARISLKAFQLYSDFEEGAFASDFPTRFNDLCTELKNANSNWEEVGQWLANWKEALETNHNYLIIDNLDNCIQTASDLGLDDVVTELHDGLIQIEVNIHELMETA